MKHSERTLRLLQEAGAYGVHTSELLARRIVRPSRRIAELEDLGHQVTARFERVAGIPGYRYTLTNPPAAAEQASGPAREGAEGEPRLFELAPAARGAYDDEARR